MGFELIFLFFWAVIGLVLPQKYWHGKGHVNFTGLHPTECQQHDGGTWKHLADRSTMNGFDESFVLPGICIKERSNCKRNLISSENDESIRCWKLHNRTKTEISKLLPRYFFSRDKYKPIAGCCEFPCLNVKEFGDRKSECSEELCKNHVAVKYGLKKSAPFFFKEGKKIVPSEISTAKSPYQVDKVSFEGLKRGNIQNDRIGMEYPFGGSQRIKLSLSRKGNMLPLVKARNIMLPPKYRTLTLKRKKAQNGIRSKIFKRLNTKTPSAKIVLRMSTVEGDTFQEILEKISTGDENEDFERLYNDTSESNLEDPVDDEEEEDSGRIDSNTNNDEKNNDSELNLSTPPNNNPRITTDPLPALASIDSAISEGMHLVNFLYKMKNTAVSEKPSPSVTLASTTLSSIHSVTSHLPSTTGLAHTMTSLDSAISQGFLLLNILLKLKTTKQEARTTPPLFNKTSTQMLASHPTTKKQPLTNLFFECTPTTLPVTSHFQTLTSLDIAISEGVRLLNFLFQMKTTVTRAIDYTPTLGPVVLNKTQATRPVAPPVPGHTKASGPAWATYTTVAKSPEKGGAQPIASLVTTKATLDHLTFGTGKVIVPTTKPPQSLTSLDAAISEGAKLLSFLYKMKGVKPEQMPLNATEPLSKTERVKQINNAALEELKAKSKNSLVWNYKVF